MSSVFDDVFEFFGGGNESQARIDAKGAQRKVKNDRNAKTKALKESRERNTGGFQNVSGISSPLESSRGALGGSSSSQLLNPLQK